MCWKKLIIIILLVMIFTGSDKLNNVLISNYVKYNSMNSIHECEYSDEYKKWLELSDEDKKTFMMPNVCKKEKKITKSLLPNYSISVFKNSVDKVSIPEKYDLRNVNGTNYVTNVKDQKQTGTCWTFAANSSIESNILKKYGKTYDFAEMHMSYYSSANYFEGGINSDGYSDVVVGSGGNFLFSSSYLTKLKGPILEEDFSMSNYYSLSYGNNKNVYLKSISLSEMQNQTTQVDVNTISVVGESSCTDDTLKTIKQTIMDNGVVQASYYSDSDYTYGAYLYHNGNEGTNHAISIVGWDDTISKSNFRSGVQPSKDGAFIIKNSWGNSCNDLSDLILYLKTNWYQSGLITSINAISDSYVIETIKYNGYVVDKEKDTACIGDDGYYYISYEDTNICKNVVSYNNIDFSVEDNTYYYDVLGYNVAISTGTEDAYVANKFIKKSNEKEFLKEVTIGFMDKTNYEVYLSRTNDLNERELIGSGIANYFGYETLVLKKPILIEEDFSIIVKYDTEYEYPIPVQDTSVSGFESTVMAKDLSYASGDGINWDDLSYYNYIPSIKAYTDNYYDFSLNVPQRINNKDVFNIPVTLNNIIEDKFIIKVYDINKNDVTDEFILENNIIDSNNIYIEKKSINTENGIYTLNVIYDTYITKEVSFEVIDSYQELNISNISYLPNTIYDNNKIYDNTGGNIIIEFAKYNIDIDDIKIEITNGNTIVDYFDYTLNTYNDNYKLNITIPSNAIYGEYTVKIYSNDIYDDIKFNIYEFVEVENINIQYNDINLNDIVLLKNDTLNIKTNVVPNNSTIKDINYNIDDTSVATITTDGLITGLKVGTTKLSFTVDNVSKEISITVIDPKTNNRTEIISNVNNNLTIDAYYGGKFNTLISFDDINIDKGITAKIVNSSNIDVSNYFTIKKTEINNNEINLLIIYNGNNKIDYGTYKVLYNYNLNDTKSTSKSEYYEINLVEYIPIESIFSNKDEYRLKIGDTLSINDLNIQINPSDSTIKTVDYNIVNDDIVSLKNNILTALKEGETILKISSENIEKDIKLVVIGEKFLNFDKSLEIINKDNINYLRSSENSLKYSELLSKINTNYEISVYDKNDNLITVDSTLISTNNSLKINNILYKIVINGDVYGDGKINYLDYVSVYNHIYKSKHLESDKKLLTGSYLISADVYKDNKINYLDYVNIYKKIKGGN